MTLEDDLHLLRGVFSALRMISQTDGEIVPDGLYAVAHLGNDVLRRVKERCI